MQRLSCAYKLWHEFLPHIPKNTRYTLGAKIDAALIETLEAIFIASFLPREKKLLYLERATVRLDLAKFFIQLLWELKAFDNKKYVMISEELIEVGKMLGGWMRQFINRTAEHQ